MIKEEDSTVQRAVNYPRNGPVRIIRMGLLINIAWIGVI